MNKYQKNMESINPPEGLEKRVLAAAIAESAKIRHRRFKPAAVLIAAALAILLCIGAAASGIYYGLVVLPGRGVVDAGENIPLVLGEVLAFGERQIDYVVLNRGETNELRVIITDGKNDSADSFDMHKLTGDKYGSFGVVKNSYYTGLTAEADGESYALAPIDEENDGEFSYFDVYVCSDFPDVQSFTLSAPTGETAQIILTEYSDANVIEQNFGPVTLRVLPMAQGSRYVFFDIENRALGENWITETVPSIVLLDENGEKGCITTCKARHIVRGGREIYEIIGRMEEGLGGHIVGFDLGENGLPMTSKADFGASPAVIALDITLPKEGETISFDEPMVIFDRDGFRIAASEMTMNNGELEFVITNEGFLTIPDGMELTYFYGVCSICNEDGGTIYRSSGGRGSQSGENLTIVLEFEPVGEYEEGEKLTMQFGEVSVSYRLR